MALVSCLSRHSRCAQSACRAAQGKERPYPKFSRSFPLPERRRHPLRRIKRFDSPKPRRQHLVPAQDHQPPRILNLPRLHLNLPSRPHTPPSTHTSSSAWRSMVHTAMQTNGQSSIWLLNRKMLTTTPNSASLLFCCCCCFSGAIPKTTIRVPLVSLEELLCAVNERGM
jgi:hypothetical protein